MKKLTAILFLLLSIGARAQVVQSQSSAQPANVQMTGGVGHGYPPSKGSGLTLNIGKGTTQCVDQLVEYGGGTLTMTDNATNYIYLDPANTCAHGQNTTGFVQGTVWHYKVTTSGGAITVIDDVRSADAVSKVAITGGGGTGGGTNNQGTVALTGCGVSWTGLLNFTVSPCTYLLAGTQYSSPQANLTLTTADATNPRIDVIAVDSTGAAIVITGTPAGSPAEPSVDPATQLRLIAVSVPALATTPSGISETDLYLENTEWTCAVSSNLACASTSNPFAGTKDIEATSAVAGNNVTLTKPSGTVDLSTYSNLILYVRSKASWANAKSLSIFWLNGSAVVGASVSVKTGQFGFNSSVTGTYQQVVIPLGSFATGTNPVNKLKISVAGGGGSIGFYADNISIQSGVINSGSGPQTFTITPTSPLSGGGTAPFGGTLTISCPTCGTGSGNVTGSSLTSGQLIKGAGGTAIQVGDLSGDVTTSGSMATAIANLAVTNAKIANSTIDLTAKVTGILPGANGGTGNGFFAVSGPASSLKTFTFPNASATVLTDNALVTGAQGGTGNGFFAVSGPASSLKTFSFPNASATVLTDNAAVSIAQGGTGTGSTLTGLVRGSASAFSAAELSGDATTSGSNAVTVTKINGTSFAGTNGNLVKFGASNVPADSSVVAANVVTASSPGVGLCHFAGSTQACTSSAVVNADITNSTIDLAAKVTGILAGTNGGTGNGFFAVSGPASSLKTLTFPNASATVLTDNAAVSIAQGGTGTGSTLTGLVRGSGSAFTAAELSGDATTSGSNAVTVAKVNGVSYSATAAAHSVEVITVANTTATATTVPDCTDTGGNHLNYAQSGDSFICGTSGSSGASANPPSPIILNENFCTKQSAGTLGWTQVFSNFNMLDNNAVDNNHLCLMRLTGASTSSYTYNVLGPSNTGSEFLNPQATTWSLIAIVANINSTGGVLRFGAFADRGVATSASGVWFEASSSGSTPTWNCITRSASSQTSNSSGVTAASNTFHKMEIDAAASSTVVFKIDGSQVCSQSGNTPNAKLTPGFQSLGNASGNGDMVINYFGMSLNASR